jgi:hypothetical protein
MKTALAAILLFSLISGLAAQPRQSSAQNAPRTQTASQPATDLNSVLADLQRVALSTNADLGKLRIEKWKADGSEKQQMQQVANSLQRNISSAVPSLITEAQAAPGSVSRTFKLYNNINIVYEFLNSLAEAAGAFGKREEYEPLANDAAALDKIRQTLSDYIEQRAVVLENPPKPATQAQTTEAPKRVVIDDTAPPPKKSRKKKKAATASNPPASSNPPQ